MCRGEMYAKMYYIVVCAASDAIDDLEAGQPLRARNRLRDALNEAEDYYLENWTGELISLEPEERKRLHAFRGELAAEYREKQNST